MKRILLLSILLIFAFSVANAQLYANFEDISPTMTPFDGSYKPVVVENPLIDDVNPSDFVFGGASSALAYEGAWFATDDFIDFSNSRVFTMLVYGSVAGNVLLKLESVDGTAKPVEVQKTYDVAEVWQEISFDFPETVESGIYNKIVVFMDMGSAVAGNLFYWDYLIGPDGYQNGISNLDNKQRNIFTNPFKDQLSIKSVSIIHEINLFNLAGQNVMVLQNVNSSSARIETSQLMNGLYFLKMKDRDGVVSTAKLIKN